MNLDVNQHETYVKAPDDLSKIVSEAIPPPAQPKVAIPVPTDRKTGLRPNGNTTRQQRSKLYGMPLAWRGLNLLGVAIGIAGLWFVTAWVIHGRLPMMTPEVARFSPSGPQDRILPPSWLYAVVGSLALISFGMMLLGTQDASPKLRKSKKPNPTPDGIRQPADGSPKPSV
ncbi:MAG: hypothetical protein AAB403_23015 [Planctomycetota bacterium]